MNLEQDKKSEENEFDKVENTESVSQETSIDESEQNSEKEPVVEEKASVQKEPQEEAEGVPGKSEEIKAEGSDEVDSVEDDSGGSKVEEASAQEEPEEEEVKVGEPDGVDSTEEPVVEEKVSSQEESQEEEVSEISEVVKEEELSGVDSLDKDSEEVNPAEYYSNILKKIKEVLETKDWGLITNEFSNLSLHIGEGPDPDEAGKALLKEFEELRSDFEERKKAHYEELNRKREENLKKKKELLKEFSEIISEENWTATKEVSQLKNKWDRITQIPRDEVEALNERFETFMKEFESHKVERLVKKLEKEEDNLTLKLLLLDKMEALNKKSDDAEADFEGLSKEFDDLHNQWRKIGRVPNEKNQMVWDRFNASEDAFNKLRFKNDKSYRDKIEQSLQKKKNLIAEAEALVDKDNIAKAARRVNKLHNAWKKTGNLPQKDENELWDKFKAATDAFNDKKSENIDVLREQEELNYDKKLKLIEQAEEIQDTDDFDKGHQSMQNLMKEWKKIGPVQRKKSSKIWKKFKGAMDVFYDNRRDHFKDRRGEEKENLEKKKEILSKLKELGKHDDPAIAVEETKKLQEEFKNAGYVPIKSKNKVWKQYREACDVIYERFRASGSDLNMQRELASEGVEPADRKKVIELRKEKSAIQKDVSKLKAESIQYEEAKTYFKPTNKGNKLRDELQEKVDRVGEKLESKKQRISEINRELSALMSSDEEE